MTFYKTFGIEAHPGGKFLYSGYVSNYQRTCHPALILHATHHPISGDSKLGLRERYIGQDGKIVSQLVPFAPKYLLPRIWQQFSLDLTITGNTGTNALIVIACTPDVGRYPGPNGTTINLRQELANRTGREIIAYGSGVNQISIQDNGIPTSPNTLHACAYGKVQVLEYLMTSGIASHPVMGKNNQRLANYNPKVTHYLPQGGTMNNSMAKLPNTATKFGRRS
ncbi:hypothetical protein MUU47_15370 [Scandinavium sp. H11S7]|uniref:Uncharacterized protein n=1 Tax=Scandinavium hiltneri TaxID=2926519 RepID=A0ABT2E461_9ENTR|nr:hypothetical protein [Scandinavium hiltneri]MCS2162476.1 hypothetical protein [Scandinavium hiltneri]